jgi:hypothetical protein
MALPNFLCVGAQKAGTTTLHEVLKQHPDIFLPQIKEPHFFDEHYAKGVSWYEKTFFSTAQDQNAIGEITPAYLYIDDVPQRILETLGPNVKLLFIFRNPAERAYSHYLMSKFNGFESATFEEAMADSPLSSGDIAIAQKRRFSYRERGYYGMQVKKYLQLFYKENMHFILFEDLISAQKKDVYAGICNFLEVKNYDLDLDIKSNVAKSVRNPFFQKIMNQSPWLSSIAKRLLPDASTRKAIRKKLKNVNQKSNPGSSNQLSHKLREQLIKDYYLADIKLLEELIEKDLSHWYSKKINC